jgi:hypothetical protein
MVIAQVLLFFILVIGTYTSIVNHRFHLRTPSLFMLPQLPHGCLHVMLGPGSRWLHERQTHQALKVKHVVCSGCGRLRQGAQETSAA